MQIFFCFFFKQAADYEPLMKCLRVVSQSDSFEWFNSNLQRSVGRCLSTDSQRSNTISDGSLYTISFWCRQCSCGWPGFNWARVEKKKKKNQRHTIPYVRWQSAIMTNQRRARLRRCCLRFRGIIVSHGCARPSESPPQVVCRDDSVATRLISMPHMTMIMRCRCYRSCYRYIMRWLDKSQSLRLWDESKLSACQASRVNNSGRDAFVVFSVLGPHKHRNHNTERTRNGGRERLGKKARKSR